MKGALLESGNIIIIIIIDSIGSVMWLDNI